MSIYKINADIKNYKAFYLIDDDENTNLQVDGYFDFKGDSKADQWKGARVFLDGTYDKSELPVADTTKFNVHALAYSEKAIEVLKSVLEESGELLQFECEGEKWWVHNITNTVDILDRKASTMELMDSGWMKAILSCMKLNINRLPLQY